MKWMSTPSIRSELAAVELRLGLAPVVIGSPVTASSWIVANCMRTIGNELLLATTRQASTKVSSAASGMSMWNGRISVAVCGGAHDDLSGRVAVRRCSAQ
jgi:hypothetical protein